MKPTSTIRRVSRTFLALLKRWPVAAVFLALAAAPTARAQYTFANVADTGNPTYAGFNTVPPALNASGTLAFFAALSAGGQGIFAGNGITTTPVAVTAGPPYAAFGSNTPMTWTPVDALGRVGFLATLDTGGQGLFRTDGTTTTTIALTSGPPYDFFQIPSMNASGRMAFMVSLDAGGEGLFSSDGTTTTTIALTTGPVFSLFDTNPSINASGTLAFEARLDSGSRGLFTSDGTTTTTIALSSGPVFQSFDSPSINASGKLGFYGALDSGGIGLFTSDGTTTTTIALTNATYSGFSSRPSIDSAGRLAFNAGFQAGGRALLIGNGTTTTQVLRTGDALFGSTVVGFAIGRDALNDAGQLGFFYQLADGRQGMAIASPAPQCLSCPGDMDGNFALNAADVQRFTQCVSAAAGGAPSPTCGCADVVADSVLNAQDISAFVTRLLTPPTCP